MEVLGIFINFTNHPSECWSKQQLNAASEYGKIFDFPFPAVLPDADEHDIVRIAEDTAVKIRELSPAAGFIRTYNEVRIIRNKLAHSKKIEISDSGQKLEEYSQELLDQYSRNFARGMKHRADLHDVLQRRMKR